MADQWQEYVKDQRVICKYGSKCYQKNPEHHSTYKHPPHVNKNIRTNRQKQRYKPYAREKTATASNVETEEVVEVNNDKNDIDKNEEKPATKSEETPSVSVELPKNISFHGADASNEVFRELFLVEMPVDFFKFYDCLAEDNIEKTLESVNLELIGPYDLLRGKLPIVDDKELYLVHWRFYYDPPEFQSVLKRKGKNEYHIGYFRDDPKENPVFLACNNSAKDCTIKPMAENIFGAVYAYLQNEKKSSPFTAIACQKLMEKVKKYAEDNNFSLEEYNMKKRKGKIVAKTFHGAGIVVPCDKKTQLGYRRLVETDATIKKLFTQLEAATSQEEKDKVLSELQPVITYASIAVDECDFGTGVEVGIDLFCSGLKELEPSALSSLTAAYSLLNREPLSKIIQAHIKYRRKGPNMSLLSLNSAE